MLIQNTQFRHSGYSLIELIITITLTSIVMVIFYTVFGQTQRQSVTPVIQIKAAQLGQAYLEEISLKRYDENSPTGNALRCNDPAYLDLSGNPVVCSTGVEEGVGNRSDFDDVDDYNGLHDEPPRDAFGNIKTGFNGFSVDISVEFAGSDDFSAPNPILAQSDLKKIQVTVTPPVSEGGQFVFTQYRGNF